MKIKMRCHFQPVRLTNSNKNHNIQTWQGYKGKKKHTHILNTEEKLEDNGQYVSKGLKTLKPEILLLRIFLKVKIMPICKDVLHFINSKVYIFHLNISEIGICLLNNGAYTV